MDIREAMHGLLSQSGMGALEDLLLIREGWERIVGEKVSAETKPYRLEAGKLFIGVQSHAWAQEIHFRIEDIKKGIKESAGIEISEVIIRKINLK